MHEGIKTVSHISNFEQAEGEIFNVTQYLMREAKHIFILTFFSMIQRSVSYYTRKLK